MAEPRRVTVDGIEWERDGSKWFTTDDSGTFVEPRHCGNRTYWFGESASPDFAIDAEETRDCAMRAYARRRETR